MTDRYEQEEAQLVKKLNSTNTINPDEFVETMSKWYSAHLAGRDPVDVLDREIDLIPFIMEAFAFNHYLHQRINSAYNKNPTAYYRLAVNSKYYSHPLLLQSGLLEHEMGRKVLGLLLYEQQEPRAISTVDTLLEHGWKTIYLSVLNHETLDLSDIFSDALRKTRLNITAQEAQSMSVIALFIGQRQRKRMVGSTLLRGIVTSLLMTQEDLANGTSHGTRFENLTKQDVDNVHMTKTGILMTSLFEEHKSQTPLRGALGQSLAFPHEIQTLEFLFDSERMTPSILDNVPFDDHDLDEVLAAYMFASKEDRPHLNEIKKYVAYGMSIKKLIRLYKQAKELYFLNNSDLLSLESDRQKDFKTDLQHSQEKVTLLEEKIQHIAKIAKDDAEKQIASTIATLKIENGKLKGQLAEERNRDVELAALRNYFFSLQNETPDETIQTDLLDETPVLEHVLCVGGRESTHRALRQYMPNAILLPMTYAEQGFDTSLLSTIVAVYIFTGYISHSLYYSVVQQCRKKKIPFTFLPRQNALVALNEIRASLATEVKD